MAFEDEEARERREELIETFDNAQDTDKRVAALNNLVEEVGSKSHPHETDAIVAPLTRALKAAQQALSLAALSSLPTLVGTLGHASHLSRALAAWLPLALERGGDQKERVRNAAKDAALALGTAALEAASHPVVGHVKGETPIVVFERVIKENGLTAKSPRVREFVTHLLPKLRAAAPKLPLRALLPSLVELLSDADGPVRESARTACIALFSSAPAAAKADLKKELERKAVRKQTMDAVLAAVFAVPAPTAPAAVTTERERDLLLPSSIRNAASSAAAGPTANALASAPDHALPPPATTPASEEGVAPVYIATKADLERTFAAMMPAFEGKETEHNWSAREQGCVKVRGMLKTGTQEQMPSELAAHVHKLNEGIIKAVLSLRTTLAMHAITLISELAAALGEELHESIEYLLTNLLKMAGFTKKIVANASQKAARDLMRHAHYRHKFLDLIWSYMQEKMVATRVNMCEHLVLLLDVFGQAHRHAMESHDGVTTMEKFLKKALPDQNKDVRAMARDAFVRFQAIWPIEAAALLESLNPSTKKQIAAAAATSGISLPSALAHGSAAKARTASAAAAAPRRPGGPSSALMAAKRAASERLARERREAEAAAVVGNGAPTAEAEVAPRTAKVQGTPTSASPRQESTTPRGANSRPQSIVVSPNVSHAPLPTTPRQGVFAQQHARSASGSSSSRGQATPRLGGIVSPPSSKIAAGLVARTRTTSSSSSHVSSASHGSASASSGSRLASGAAGAVKSRPPTTLSPASLKARSRTASASSSSAASARAAAASVAANANANEDADETAQLQDLEDVSVDLMAFSSPLGGGGGASKFKPGALAGRSVEERTKLEAQAAEHSARHLLDLIEDPDTTLAIPVTPTPASASASASVTPASPVVGVVSPGSKRSGLPRPKSLIGTPRGASTLVETQPAASKATPAEAPATPGGKPLRVGGATQGAAWFLKRASRLDDASLASSPLQDKPDATSWAQEIVDGTADLRTFRRLAKLSSEFKVPLVTSATEAEETLRPGLRQGEEATLALEMMKAEENEGREAAIEAWQQEHLFDRLWSALLLHLERPPKSEEVKSAGLVVLQRLVENQLPLIASTGKEAELLALLFRLRRERERYTLNACDALIDAWTARTEPILGLGTLTAALGSALVDPATTQAGDSARVRVYTLGLRSLGQVLLRLPPELVEEELPRAKALIKDAYNDANVDLRQAAVQVIIAAHQRLKDTAVLFGLLAPLEPSQLDLLSYYLAKVKV